MENDSFCNGEQVTQDYQRNFDREKVINEILNLYDSGQLTEFHQSLLKDPDIDPYLIRTYLVNALNDLEETPDALLLELYQDFLAISKRQRLFHWLKRPVNLTVVRERNDE